MKARQSNWPGDPSRRSSRTTRSPVPPAVLLLRRILRWNAPDAEGLRGRINTVIRAYLRWNRHLRLDPWMRYRPVVSAIATVVPDQDARVLDVGSGSVGLAHFLGRSVVGVDVEFTDRDWEQVPSRLVPVRGSATHLPFRDESFDAVVSMDTLEHIPRAGRPQAVAELFRVGRRLVVLGFPFGEASSRFDGAALLEERGQGVVLGWRDEHVRYRLPGQELHHEIVAAVQRRRPEMALSWFPQEGLRGLRLRWKLQLLIRKESRLYGLLFYPLYWLTVRGKPKRAYRRIYIATKQR